MKTLVETLPEENYASLRYLIKFLAQVQRMQHLPLITVTTFRAGTAVTLCVRVCVCVFRYRPTAK